MFLGSQQLVQQIESNCSYLQRFASKNRVVFPTVSYMERKQMGLNILRCQILEVETLKTNPCLSTTLVYKMLFVK